MTARRSLRLCFLSLFSSTNATAAGTPFAQKPASETQLQPWRIGLKLSRTYCHKSGNVLENIAVQRHLKRLLEEYQSISSILQSESVNESERRLLTRKLLQLSEVANTFQSRESAVKELAEIKALLHHSTSNEATEDKQLIALLRDEQHQIDKRITTLNRKLIQTLVPCDVHDNSDVIAEVAAGRTTGGDICQQFTREMFDMYQKFASYKGWDFEVLNYTAADYGGLHHAAVRIAGDNVHRWLKFEGGTHRVQRIPEVGLSSRMQRIHTGTMMVIVLPQPHEVDIIIDSKDLRIDTFRSRGAGGQSVNTTDSAVRIVHLPTGIVAECQQSRSQLQNRDMALRVLKARLYQSTLGQQMEEMHTARKKQVGTRAQSERIRTYNFSQDRVTDHRIGYVTHDIKELMRGGELLEELIWELQNHAEREALLQLVENSSETQPANT